LRAQESNHAYPDRWFQYDGARPVLEGTLSGDTFTATERYVWEKGSYYSPLVYQVYANSRYYPLSDHRRGSTRQLLDESQVVTDTYTYEAFGNSMGSSGSTPNPYKYVGSLGYYQTGSSLMHLGARYYMPEIGRFVQPDALWVTKPGDDRYTYAKDSPGHFVDPSGRILGVDDVVIIIVIGGVIVVSVVGAAIIAKLKNPNVDYPCPYGSPSDPYKWKDPNYRGYPNPLDTLPLTWYSPYHGSPSPSNPGGNPYLD
jgi:RHS repeat-associated protein